MIVLDHCWHFRMSSSIITLLLQTALIFDLDIVGGGGAPVAAAAAPAAGAAAAAPAAEEKEEAKEESDDDMGFSLFDWAIPCLASAYAVQLSISVLGFCYKFSRFEFLRCVV
jgi:hypothetical protein